MWKDILPIGAKSGKFGKQPLSCEGYAKGVLAQRFKSQYRNTLSRCVARHLNGRYDEISPLEQKIVHELCDQVLQVDFGLLVCFFIISYASFTKKNRRACVDNQNLQVWRNWLIRFAKPDLLVLAETESGPNWPEWACYICFVNIMPRCVVQLVDNEI